MLCFLKCSCKHFHSRVHRAGNGLPQAAEGSQLQVVGERHQRGDVALFPAAVRHTGQDLQCAPGPHPAGGALAARFDREETQQFTQEGDRRDALVAD